MSMSPFRHLLRWQTWYEVSRWKLTWAVLLAVSVLLVVTVW